MNTAFCMCVITCCVNVVKCNFDITRWTPPEGLENPCPSKPEPHYYTINSAQVLVIGMACDMEKLKETDFSWRGKCSQAYITVDELGRTDQTGHHRIKVACLPHHYSKTGTHDFYLRGSLIGASQSSDRETRSSREHRRRKRHQWMQKCRRYGRFWHSVGDKILV